MIIQNRTADEVLVEGESDVRQASISKEKMGKLQYILTKALYSDPISSTIVESVNNGVDGLVQSGKDPLEFPVMVEIGTRSNGSYFFRVEDKGIGMSKETFIDVVMNYLESTKEESDDLIGSWGLGAKAFLSLDRAGTFICRRDGKEVKFLVYQGAEFCEYDLLYEKDITEGDGVIFEIDIRDRYEKREFEQKAIKKLAYYDTVALIIDGSIEENIIYRQEDFQWSDNCGTREMHLCLKDVFYEINWTKLGLAPIMVPIALRFNLGDGLAVTPPRDSLIYDKKVIELIKTKIHDVADWFQEKYDEEVEMFDNFVIAVKHLRSTDKFVSLGETEIKINDLEQYMSKTCTGIQVKGLVLQTPHTYFAHLERMCRNFHLIGNISWNGQYKSKNIYGDLRYAMLQEYKGVLLDQHPVGKVKEFLKSKYGRNTYLFIDGGSDLQFYKDALRLDSIKDKSKWRSLIKELQELHRQIKDNYLEKRLDIRNSKEFLKWEEEQKEIAKANKASGLPSIYKTLDKQEGEVTIAYARKPLIGHIPVFEKNTYNIEGLKKLNHVLLIFNEEDKEEAKSYYNLHKNLKVAIVGKRERTKLPETHQIMGKEKFEKTKLFKRIVTAIRIGRILESWNKITSQEETIVEECLKKVDIVREELRKYHKENFIRMYCDEGVENAFLTIARQYSLWDEEILYKVKEMEKALNTFYFLEYIEYPRYGSEEDKKKVKRIINQLLLFQKKHGALDNYELIEKPIPEEYLEEQLKEEEEFMSSPEAELAFA